MSSTGESPDNLDATRINATIGIAAFIVIFGCVAFFITLDLCLRVLVRRYTGILPLGTVQQRQGTGTHVNLLNKGLDQAVINSLLPAFIYESGDRDKIKGATTECAVCLSEFEHGERGRLLPKCNHAFHADCIDMWFQSHSTCPICRSAVVDNADSSNPSASAPEAVAIVVSGSEGQGNGAVPANSSGSPIQVASASALDEAASVVIVIPRLEEEEARGRGIAATDASSSSPRSSSFHTVLSVTKEPVPEPKSPVVTATMERLRSFGRLWSRRDLANSPNDLQQQLPSPRV